MVRSDNVEWNVMVRSSTVSGSGKRGCMLCSLMFLIVDDDGAGFSVASISVKELREMWKHGKVVFLIPFMVLKFSQPHLPLFNIRRSSGQRC